MRLRQFNEQTRVCTRVYTQILAGRSQKPYHDLMTAAESGSGDREIGVRAFREQLPSLLAEVEKDRTRIFVTRNGKRTVALVRPDDAPSTAPVVAFPGNVEEASRVILGLRDGNPLLQDERGTAKVFETPHGELVGGMSTILFVFQAHIADYIEGGMLRLDDGTTGDSLANIITRKVVNDVNRLDNDILGIQAADISIIAGAIWMLQLEQSPADWRNMIRRPLSGGEVLAWAIATWHFADIVDKILKDDASERFIYEACEKAGEIARALKLIGNSTE